MTTVLGSKRWITAVLATGALVAVSGCTGSEPDGGDAPPPSAGTASASPAPSGSAAPSSSAAPSASAAPSGTPSSSPSAGAAPSASTPPSGTPSSNPSASAAPSSTPSSVPAAGGTCTAAQLTGSVSDEPGGGAAGSAYRALVLTNASGQECTVQGYPGVSLVDLAGTRIGAAAERDGTAEALVTLAPGASASTTLQQTNAGNYGAECGITLSAGLRVYPPGATDSLVLPQEIAACSAESIVLLRVGALQPAG